MTEIVFVSVMTDLINLIKPTYNSSCVCVHNHEDLSEKRDMFADCDHCPESSLRHINLTLRVLD
jgi:hypothetical protein